MVFLQDQTYISSRSGRLSKMVVFLHGYGASGQDLLGLSQHWEGVLPSTVFTAPNAPEPCDIKVSGYQWFGLPDFSPFNMRLGLERAGPVLKEYLGSQMIKYQLSPQDLALVGFSQGAILALEMMFLMPKVGAILGYSGAFFAPNKVLLEKPQTKIMLVHGTLDTVVPYAALSQAKTQGDHLGIQIKTYTCNGLDHSINPEGINIGGEFLKDVFYPLKA